AGRRHVNRAAALLQERVGRLIGTLRTRAEGHLLCLSHLRLPFVPPTLPRGIALPVTVSLNRRITATTAGLVSRALRSSAPTAAKPARLARPEPATPRAGECRGVRRFPAPSRPASAELCRHETRD